MSVRIDKEKCILCGACAAACPNGALEIIGDEVALNESSCILCGACRDACPMEAVSVETSGKTPVSGSSDSASPEKSSPYAGVWIIVQQSEGTALPVAFELLGKGRELADQLGCTLTAVSAGRSSSFAQELASAGADRVICVTADWIGDTDDGLFADLLAPLIRERRPEIVLFGATMLGRSAAPRVAAMLGAGLTADCTALSIEPDSGLLAQTRPALGGNLMATIVCPSARPQMATVRPGVFPVPEAAAGRAGDSDSLRQVREDDLAEDTFIHPERIEIITPSAKPESLPEIISRTKKEEGAGISDAELLLVAGRGIGSEKNLKKVFELADLLGARVGVSRPLIDMGWAEYPHQVGQTGTAVSPKVLISLGVSGAIQHLAGIGGAKTVIAVNTDADAPIMKRADYAIVQDCIAFVQALTDLTVSEGRVSGNAGS